MKNNRKRKSTNKLDAREKNFLKEFGSLHPINEEKKNNANNNIKSKIINESLSDNSSDELLDTKKPKIIDQVDVSSNEDTCLPYQKLLNQIILEEDSHVKKAKTILKVSKNQAKLKQKIKKSIELTKKDTKNDSDSDEFLQDSMGDTLYSKEVLCKDNMENEDTLKIDPFHNHFEINISNKTIEKINSHAHEEEIINWPSLGTIQFNYYDHKPSLASFTFDIKENFIKQRVQDRLGEALDEFLPNNESKLTDKQQEMLRIITNYIDFYNPHVNLLLDDKQNKFSYTIHALNHILKTRSRVIAHNDKIKQNNGNQETEYHDQGLTRPKVLILVPFKKDAFTIVNIIIKLLMRKNEEYITNKRRFNEEFSNVGHEKSQGDDEHVQNSKGEEYRELFSGNVDDHFRLGLSISKRTLKLYTEFYSSDMIIASPLGLRTIIDNENGDKKLDRDFLSSLEIVVIDNADVLLMQNWDHVTTILNNLHILPKESHNTDFSRVRPWHLDGLSKYYCQKIILSSIRNPAINNIFNKFCTNFSGKIQIKKVPEMGAICNIGFQLAQVFHKIPLCESPADLPNRRFEFFVNKVLPQFKDEMKSHTLIYCSSYFDFVRIKNYLKKNDIKSTCISEYSEQKQVDRSRYVFYHGRVHFMLISERLHFYKRYRIRGINHIIFYDLPEYSQYYSEFCNFLQDPKRFQTEGQIQSSFSCTVLYSQYDAHKLSCVVGYNRASQMLNSDKNVHMFMTES